MARHTFEMLDEFEDQRNDTPHSTRVEQTFETEMLQDIVDEFKCYLWHCGFTYVEGVTVECSNDPDQTI